MSTNQRVAWVIASALLAAGLVWLATITPDRLAVLISAQFPEVQWVDRDRLTVWLRDGPDPAPLLLDARRPEEYAVSHLPGAVRIDPARPDLDAIDLSVDRPVVVYCSVGYRSAGVVEALQARGADEVYNLRGGIFAWANEGRPIARDGAPADAVHPYDAWWGRLLCPGLRAQARP